MVVIVVTWLLFLDNMIAMLRVLITAFVPFTLQLHYFYYGSRDIITNTIFFKTSIFASLAGSLISTIYISMMFVDLLISTGEQDESVKVWAEPVIV